MRFGQPMRAKRFSTSGVSGPEDQVLANKAVLNRFSQLQRPTLMGVTERQRIRFCRWETESVGYFGDQHSGKYVRPIGRTRC